MKNFLIPITVLALFLSSCDVVSFDEDINKNPNLPSQAAPTQLIANAMLSLPDLSSSPQGEYLAQYLSKTEYIPERFYEESGTSFYWLYQGPLINLQTAIENARTPNEEAVAKILKAYYFWHITDRWGDVPYSEALQGADDFTPAYDTQQSIYNSLFALLKEAESQIVTSGTLSNDLMYGGDMTKWKKLSSTIRLLMALRLSEVDAEKAEAEFNAALEAGIMTSNDDNFVFRHLANANNQNYWYERIEVDGDRWWVLSGGIVDLMKPLNDPRLSVYGDTTSTGDYVGLPFGTNDEELINMSNLSMLGSSVRAQDAPVYLVTYAQALFAKAEAAELGWINEDAATNYNMAIENSILQWTGSTDDVAAYLAQPEVAYDSANAIEQIATQRYLHLFMHGYEAWAEWRRTDYPSSIVEPNGNAVSLRQSYPAEEALNNTENYEEAVNRETLGGENSIYSRVWWDVD